MIKSENGRLLNYVTLNVRGRDIVGFVDEAQRVVSQKVKLPEGVHIEWSGEFEHQVRAARTLRFVFPAVILLIFVILYLTYNDLADAGTDDAGRARSVGRWGVLSCSCSPRSCKAGPLRRWISAWPSGSASSPASAWRPRRASSCSSTCARRSKSAAGWRTSNHLEELRQAVIEGAVHRLRPKLLTEGVAIIAIFPMVFAKGVGGEILAPMALPVLGGLLISDEVVDLFLPVRFYWVRRARWLKLQKEKQQHVDIEVPMLPL